MDEIYKGKKITVVSDITYREIELAPNLFNENYLICPRMLLQAGILNILLIWLELENIMR